MEFRSAYRRVTLSAHVSRAYASLILWEESMKVLSASCAIAALAFALSATAQTYAPPRTPDGKPDLQGVWSNQSLTNLSRTPNMKLSPTKEEAKEMVKNNPWILLAQSEEGASNLAD